MDEQYLKRLGTETVYLYDDERDVFVKSVGNGGGFSAKGEDGREYRIENDSDIALQAVVGEHEITKQQYDNARL